MKFERSTQSRWRQIAGLWLHDNPGFNGGYVKIFRGKSVGWVINLERAPAKNYEPGVVLVPQDSGTILVSTGGTASLGAEKWEEVE